MRESCQDARCRRVSGATRAPQEQRPPWAHHHSAQRPWGLMGVRWRWGRRERRAVCNGTSTEGSHPAVGCVSSASIAARRRESLQARRFDRARSCRYGRNRSVRPNDVHCHGFPEPLQARGEGFTLGRSRCGASRPRSRRRSRRRSRSRPSEGRSGSVRARGSCSRVAARRWIRCCGNIS